MAGFRRSAGTGGDAGATDTAEEATALETLADEVAAAAGSIAEDAAKATVEKVRRSGAARYLLIIAVGAVLAIALSESLRSKALDVLFGAEEEFDYTSTTTPATPAPAGAPAA